MIGEGLVYYNAYKRNSSYSAGAAVVMIIESGYGVVAIKGKCRAPVTRPTTLWASIFCVLRKEKKKNDITSGSLSLSSV